MADPYRNFKFEVEIGGFVRAGFSKVTGLKHTVEQVEYREGAENETPRKLPGQSTYDDVVFERGMSTDSDFVDWMAEVFNLDNVEGVQGDDSFRKTIVVYLKNKAGDRAIKWTIYRAWPHIDDDADLDASANEVAVESLTVAHEGVKKQVLIRA